MWKKLLLIGLAAMLTLWACAGDDDDDDNTDTTTDDTDTGSGTGVDTDMSIGSSCHCEGDACASLGVPVPNAATIVGCDDVSETWTGAEKVCMRSYNEGLANATYFANGYCSLMALDCEGEWGICGSAIMGDHAAMVECPAGTVMLEGSRVVNVLDWTATTYNKTCLRACETAEVCRADEYDPVLDEPTQYDCIDHGGVKACYDPRNIEPEDVLTQY